MYPPVWNEKIKEIYLNLYDISMVLLGFSQDFAWFYPNHWLETRPCAGRALARPGPRRVRVAASGRGGQPLLAEHQKWASRQRRRDEDTAVVFWPVTVVNLMDGLVVLMMVIQIIVVKMIVNSDHCNYGE